MEERCKEKYPNRKFKVLDVLDISFFENGEFNIILDKGSIDCIFVGIKYYN